MYCNEILNQQEFKIQCHVHEINKFHTDILTYAFLLYVYYVYFIAHNFRPLGEDLFLSCQQLVLFKVLGGRCVHFAHSTSFLFRD